MSESSGILLSGIGQSLIQFADIQHDTKISSLEAEAQRQKEIRLQEMQVSRDAITDSFRLADLESSQERLRLAQAADLRAQEKHDKKSYIWKEVPKYGWVEETVTEYDPYLQQNVEKIKKNWEKVGSHWMGINEDDPKDRVVIGADGTYLSGDEANSIIQSDTTADDPKVTEVSFAEYEAAYAKTDPKYTGSAEDKQKLRLMGEARGITFIDSTAAGAPSAADVLSPDARETYPEFQELDASSAKSPFTEGSRMPVAPEPSVTAQTGYDPNQEWVPNVTDPIGPEDYLPKPTPADTFTVHQAPKPTTRFPNLGTAVETTETASSDATANTGGQAVPELPPDPNKVVVEAESAASMPEVFAYDAAKSKAFIEGLIKEMQAVNISQEDIRKELLSILGEIPKEQANGEFAKAVANAYYEFTKGAN